jgi:hypothetical protein
VCSVFVLNGCNSSELPVFSGWKLNWSCSYSGHLLGGKISSVSAGNEISVWGCACICVHASQFMLEHSYEDLI